MMKKNMGNIICICLAVVILVLGYIYMNIEKEEQSQISNPKTNFSEETQIVKKRTIIQQLTNSGEIKTSKTEKLKLNTDKRFKRVCISQNDIVKKGEPILEYTNGSYLYAPYDLVVTGISVPEKSKEYCTKMNYIEVQNIEKFYIEMEVKESQIGKLTVGQQVTIEVNALENKTYTGKVSHINPIGIYENKKSVFKVLIEFENDSDRNVKIGMSAFCTVIIQEAKDVISVPIQSVQKVNEEKYVMIKTQTGEIKKQVVETGISDSNYVEIKTGLSGGENVVVPKASTQKEEQMMESTITLRGM